MSESNMMMIKDKNKLEIFTCVTDNCELDGEDIKTFESVADAIKAGWTISSDEKLAMCVSCSQSSEYLKKVRIK